jgi:hypothetical protein
MFDQQFCGTKEGISQCPATGNYDLQDTYVSYIIFFPIRWINVVWFVYLALNQYWLALDGCSLYLIMGYVKERSVWLTGAISIMRHKGRTNVVAPLDTAVRIWINSFEQPSKIKSLF